MFWNVQVRFSAITMNLSVYVLLIVIKCLHQTAGNPNVLFKESKIMGGHEAKPHSHPYIVSLQTRLMFLRMHICGGVLVNKQFVLSAAHCATESWLIRWLPMDVVAGVHDVNNFRAQTQVLQIVDRIPHPLYEGGIGPHDIALFKTVKPFLLTKVVQPIKLSSYYNYKSGESLTLLGWGALRTTTFIPDMPYGLQKVDVTYIPYKDCYNAIEKLKEANDANPLDEDSNICTGPTTGGIAACVGDSGGPLIRIINEIIPPPNDPVEQSTEKYNKTLYDCPNDNSDTDNKNNKKEGKQLVEGDGVEAVLVGIVSWGVSPCGEIGAPTVYTNTTFYKYFIKYNIENN